jgi:nitrite reductase/ring-hydroxylating ferredoxin subunit
MAEFHAVLKLAELAPGSMRTCIIAGREIVVCHTREGVFALDNICTHAHARLCEGRLRATRLVCPLHGASFDIRDGRVLGPPAEVPLRTHAVRLVEGVVEVALAAEAGGPAPQEPAVIPQAAAPDAAG